MSSVALETLVVGSEVFRGGFFTKLHFLGALANGSELERRIGYAPGRLRHGWYLLLMLERPPSETEFDFAGYSHFSGGVVKGHSKLPGDRGPSVEDSMRNDGIDMQVAKRSVARNFTVQGPERLAKIVPAEKDLDDPETSVQQGKYWHPDLNPIAQWKLTCRARFVVEKYFPAPR